ncbi:MAG: hypothetical protein KME27_10600 [Lyngbya sp. HA4199-MV5]|nr:hypothetical protein [Lyngbya sp. HA4199-MV5]
MTETYLDRAQLLQQRLITALGDLLGTYTSLNGETTPAIAIDDTGSSPQGMSVEGLEVVIQPEVNTPVTAMLGSNQIAAETTITLKQWDLNDTTIAATEALLLAIDEITEVSPRVVRSTVLDNIESRRITVTLTRVQRVMRAGV